MPFDCSQIIWNDAPPLPLPESEVVNKATALTQTVNRQLHPENRTMIRASAPPLGHSRNQAWFCWMILATSSKTQDLCSSPG